jgi:hypothetical protein
MIGHIYHIQHEETTKPLTYACEAHLIFLEVLHIMRRFAMGNRLK